MATATRGRELLNAYLAADRNRSQVSLARVLDINQSSVSGWCRGTSRPESPHRTALLRIAGIPEDAWLTGIERRALAKAIAAADAPESLAPPAADSATHLARATAATRRKPASKAS